MTENSVYQPTDGQRVHLYRAKIKNPAPTMDPRWHWVEGGYVKHICRQVCVLGDDRVNPEDIKHLIVRSGFADWNMPRSLEAIEIDVDTLCEFTEMLDVDGNPIFENAIVEFPGDIIFDDDEMGPCMGHEHVRARVSRQNGRWELVGPKTVDKAVMLTPDSQSALMAIFKICRVVGNYIDHHNLFEDAKNNT